MKGKQQFFSNKLGFLMAAVAMAVGTGNIWRFPRMAAANGGGAFLIVLIIAVIVFSVPLLMSEMAIGRYSRKGSIGAIGDVAGRGHSWVGAWLAFVCIAITFYYSVVTGWTLKYVMVALQGKFTSGVSTRALWETFSTNPTETIFYHFLAMLGTFVILYQGIVKGIERFTKILMPILGVLLVVAAVWALTLPGSSLGVKYLFQVDTSSLLNPRIWLEGFTQAAWSTGAGWALMMTYAIYTKPKSPIGGSMYIVAMADVLVAVIAGLAILPTIFALAPDMQYAQQALESGNVGLTFIYMSELFTSMPGGAVIAIVFFLCLSFAAISSLISQVEVGVANLTTGGFPRKKAVAIVCGVAFICGIPSAYSIDFLNNQDTVWGVALLLSGLFTSVVIIKFGVEKLRRDHINQAGSKITIGRWYNVMTYLNPFVILTILGWLIYGSVVSDPQNWWNPLKLSSTANMIMQWLVVLFTLIALNKWLHKRFAGNSRHIRE
ncbi:sodium-dependent transporter [Perlabentimonas gracilis]|uniref:sodium-dependent transporter n=1 Tax=Perlabentimonas gracilis TaxID=2715279 RepID=UPI00140ADC86|nr:sodium-dependent transporter [Perlabentimonas gracilis]NHB69493.1 sodium-dependent transporter [Perlabentimonas gracilis]